MKLSRRSALVATGLGLIGPRVLAQTDAGVSRETVSKHLSALDNYVDDRGWCRTRRTPLPSESGTLLVRCRWAPSSTLARRVPSDLDVHAREWDQGV